MTMGQRILAARQEAGLSQRQLAGEEITRNMLSALEHDCANPSVTTLKYLSEKLCKPISYFLGEDGPDMGGYDHLEAARGAFDAGAYRDCLDALEGAGGGAMAREVGLLRGLCLLALGEQAIDQGRLPYARTLLEQARRAGEGSPYLGREFRGRLMVAMARCADSAELPDVDGVLLLKAKAALSDGRQADARRYLDAAEDRKSPEWNYLRGEAHFAGREYREAAQCYHRAEKDFDLRARLEVCYRELEDYKMAYYYAKQ